MSTALLLSTIIVVAGCVGGAIPFFFQWTHRSAHRWIALGAGTILGAAFLHMIPEGFELAGVRGLPAILVGFLILYTLEQFTLKHPHAEEQGNFRELGVLTFVSFMLHNLIDGVALGSGTHVAAVTPAVFLAVALHKLPTTFALALLLLHGGLRRRIVVTFLAIVLVSIPLGVMLSEMIIQLVGGAPEWTVGILLQFSAGTFLYIGAYELLPAMHRNTEPGQKTWLFFTAGVVLMALMKLLLPAAH